MRCLNYKTLKIHGEVFHVPCGQCIACLSKRSSDWQFRLQKEMEYCDNKAVFVTLTYAPEHVPQLNGELVLVKKHLQNFFRYMRRQGLPVRYFAKGEYGGMFQRPHYHVILFNYVHNQENYEKLAKCWKFGFVSVSKVTPRRIAYTCKYLFKFVRESEPAVKEFTVMSKHPYLGYGYVNDPSVQNWHFDGLRTYAVLRDGVKVSLPRTIREKIFRSKFTRQCIALRNYKEATKRMQFEYNEIFGSNDQAKKDKWSRQDIEEYEFQQELIKKLKYKEQLKKEQYVNLQKLKAKKAQKE